MKTEIAMLEGKRAVIFDLDGTLIDSMWLWKEIDVEFLGRFGLEYPVNLPDLLGGKSFLETAVFFKEYFNLPMSIEEIMAEWNRMADWKYTHEIDLKPGVKEFLERLQQDGIRMGIATSNSRELVDGLLAVRKVTGFFDVIMTAGEVTRGKPAPDIYLAAAAGLGVAPEECLVFEDVTEGIMAGKNAGMTVCAVEDSYSDYQMAEKLRLADYRLTDFRYPEAAVSLKK